MDYLDMSTVKERRATVPPLSRSRSGYGSKLPTGIMLRIAKRWHRVYVICWSNSGTAYVIKAGKPLYIASGEL